MPWLKDEGIDPTDEYKERKAFYAERLIIDDTRKEVGCILQFYEKYPYYGVAHGIGRTGPMQSLEKCRERVEKMAFSVEENKCDE